jgi:hypothetical protein
MNVVPPQDKPGLARRLPDFLVIGAMKAGTTSLTADLEALPAIYVPSVKEPHFLCSDAILDPGAVRDYSRLFERAAAAQLCGEASTGYSKLPDVRGVPARARQLLGGELRLIYIVRNPVARAVSHHYHLSRDGRIGLNADEAIQTTPALIDYGRYWMQLAAWLEHFPAERIRVVVFEEYIRDPRATLNQLARFLGVEPPGGGNEFAGPRNTGETVLVPRRGLQRLVNSITWSHWYKIYVHPRLPRMVSRVAKSALLRKPRQRPAPPRADTVRRIVERVADDAEQLRQWMGRSDPLWDFEEAIAEFTRKA